MQKSFFWDGHIYKESEAKTSAQEQSKTIDQ